MLDTEEWILRKYDDANQFFLGISILLACAGCGDDEQQPSNNYTNPAPVVGQTTTLDVPGTYTTIQAAVDAARSGDFIRIAAGAYRESVTVADKALSLRGAGIGQTQLHGSVTITNSSETSFEGFSVIGGGMFVERSQLRMSGNEIIRSPGIGVQMKYCFSSVVSDNTIANHAREGIVLDESGGVVGSNRIRDNGGDGLVINNASPTVQMNTITENARDGISIRGFSYQSAPLLLHNVVEDNGGISNYDIICFGGANPSGLGNAFERCLNCVECRSLDDAATYQY